MKLLGMRGREREREEREGISLCQLRKSITERKREEVLI